MRTTKIVFILLLTTIYLGTPSPSVYGFGMGMPWYCHFIYPFFHASIFHLAINSYSFYQLFRSREIKPLPLLLITYGISLLSSFLSCIEQPTIGLSGAIYALCGIHLSSNMSRRNVVLSLVAIAASLILKGVNPYIHVYSWIIGIVVGLGIRLVKIYKSDIKGVVIRK